MQLPASRPRVCAALSGKRSQQQVLAVTLQVSPVRGHQHHTSELVQNTLAHTSEDGSDLTKYGGVFLLLNFLHDGFFGISGGRHFGLTQETEATLFQSGRSAAARLRQHLRNGGRRRHVLQKKKLKEKAKRGERRKVKRRRGHS